MLLVIDCHSFKTIPVTIVFVQTCHSSLYLSENLLNILSQDAVEQLPSTQLADSVAALVKATLTERLEVLDAIDLATRLRVTLPLLLRHIQNLKVDILSH